jgi:methylenetetrahydrofolate dehydrogenase (NADP+) / methenyltetrahydrofolate cyclohydrolase
MTDTAQSPLLIDGKATSQKIMAALATRVEALKSAHGITPCLATILVGDDPASATYVKMKGKACERVGMRSERYALPNDTTTDQLAALIDELNGRDDLHGILLQHPVPKQIDERHCFDAIALAKDVDGVTTWGYGRMAMGEPAFESCTPKGIMRLLDEYNVPIEGAHAVVIGRSAILGKPMAALLLNRNATVTIAHSKTRDLPALVRQADIVVAAVGKPRFVKGDWLKPGAWVMDAGYTQGNIGDVDFDAALPIVAGITPVPGGVGPMTIAMLLESTVVAAEKMVG